MGFKDRQSKDLTTPTRESEMLIFRQASNERESLEALSKRLDSFMLLQVIINCVIVIALSSV